MQVETFGLHLISRAQILATVGAHQTGKLDEPALLKKLRALDGVDDASVAVVAVDKQTVLYVGIRESSDKNPAKSAYRAAPTGEVQLPGKIVRSYHALLTETKKAVELGKPAEKSPNGHSLMEYAPARKHQEQFVLHATTHLALLQKALHEAKDAEQRRVAALVIAYAKDKQAIANDLVRASNDPDSTVRNNAVRNLGVMMQWAKDKDIKMDVDVAPFFAQLNSLTWSDRNKSLLLLTMAGVAAEQIPKAQREEVVAALAEMAQWQTFGHCLPAALLLGKMAGYSDFAVFASIKRSEGKREARAKWVAAALTRLHEKKQQ